MFHPEINRIPPGFRQSSEVPEVRVWNKACYVLGDTPNQVFPSRALCPEPADIGGLHFDGEVARQRNTLCVLCSKSEEVPK